MKKNIMILSLLCSMALVGCGGNDKIKIQTKLDLSDYTEFETQLIQCSDDNVKQFTSNPETSIEVLSELKSECNKLARAKRSLCMYKPENNNTPEAKATIEARDNLENNFSQKDPFLVTAFENMCARHPAGDPKEACISINNRLKKNRVVKDQY